MGLDHLAGELPAGDRRVRLDAAGGAGRRRARTEARRDEHRSHPTATTPPSAIDAPLDDGEEELDEPPPATWAGKQGWSGLPDEEPEADADEELEADQRLEPDADEEEEPEGFAEPGPDRDEAEDPELTREADTLAIADQEEAREAALAGLRARTAEHAAKRGVTDPDRRR